MKKAIFNQPPADVSVRDFGAVGDGVADDTSALQNALDTRAARVLIPTGCYSIRRTLEPAAGQCLILEGTIRIADAERSDLVRDFKPGDNSIRVKDASGFQVGDTISIHDDNLRIQGGGRKVRRGSFHLRQRTPRRASGSSLIFTRSEWVCLPPKWSDLDSSFWRPNLRHRLS